MSANEILTYLGIFVGGIFLTIAGYGKKPKPSDQESVVAGIGMEIGSREQTERLITEQKRCADHLASISISMAVLADRKQEMIEDKLDELLERMGEKERRG